MKFLKDIDCKCKIVKNFSPAWFASVMGTGIVALTCNFYSKYIAILKDISIFIFYFNMILFFSLIIPWVLRWIFFREDAIANLKHPILSNFYATIAIAMLVISANLLVIGHDIFLAKLFWILGSLLTILFSILTPYIVFTGSHVKISHINPAWFIPPVGLIVIPIAGSFFIQSMKEIAIVINYFGWGAGFFIYLALLAICMYRFILYTPLPSTLAPTIWINLGPIGAGSIALINLIKATPFISIREPFFVFALLFWGFGIWWVMMAILLTIHYIKKISLPYAMSWWAFTFPLGAYSAASHKIAMLFNIPIIDHIGFCLFLLLLFLWSHTLIKTFVHAYYGTLFKD